MNNSLAGLVVLITRPKGQADKLQRMIERGGGVAHHFPAMDIAPIDAVQHRDLVESNRQTILNLDRYQHIIAISTNAVRYGVDLIEQLWPQIPITARWHAIGVATAKALAQRGIYELDRDSLEGAMNSEMLLESKNLQQLEHQKILIIRGIGGRDYLQQQLSLRGAAVDYLQCYERKIPQTVVGELSGFLDSRAVNVICANSLQSAEHFSSMLGVKYLPGLKNFTIVVPSERVADQIRGYKRVIVAENASDKAVVAALEKCISHYWKPDENIER